MEGCIWGFSRQRLPRWRNCIQVDESYKGRFWYIFLDYFVILLFHYSMNKKTGYFIWIYFLCWNRVKCVIIFQVCILLVRHQEASMKHISFRIRRYFKKWFAIKRHNLSNCCVFNRAHVISFYEQLYYM